MERFLPLYYSLYLWVFILAALFAIHKDVSKRFNYPLDTFLLWFFSFILVYLFGSRDYDVGTDTPRYYESYTYMTRQSSVRNALSTPHIGRDPVFNLSIYALSKVFTVRQYFYIVAALCVFPISIAITRLSRENRLLVFFGFLCMFITPNLGINIVRNGMSIAFVILSSVCYLRSQRRSSLLFIVIATLCHGASIIVPIAWGLSRILKHQFYISILFILTATLGIIGIGVQHLPVIGNYIATIDRFAEYLTGDESMKRLPLTTFITLTSVAVYQLIMAQKINDEYYSVIGKVFLILACFYFGCSTISYSYRIAIYAWGMVPLILAYPLVKFKVFNKYQHIFLFLLFVLIELYSLYQLKQFFT